MADNISMDFEERIDSIEMKISSMKHKINELEDLIDRNKYECRPCQCFDYHERRSLE